MGWFRSERKVREHLALLSQAEAILLPFTARRGGEAHPDPQTLRSSIPNEVALTLNYREIPLERRVSLMEVLASLRYHLVTDPDELGDTTAMSHLALVLETARRLATGEGIKQEHALQLRAREHARICDLVRHILDQDDEFLVKELPWLEERTRDLQEAAGWFSHDIQARELLTGRDVDATGAARLLAAARSRLARLKERITEEERRSGRPCVCGAVAPPDALYCDECGCSFADLDELELEVDCATCGAVNRPAARFCKRCGAATVSSVR